MYPPCTYPRPPSQPWASYVTNAIKAKEEMPGAVRNPFSGGGKYLEEFSRGENGVVYLHADGERLVKVMGAADASATRSASRENGVDATPRGAVECTLLRLLVGWRLLAHKLEANTTLGVAVIVLHAAVGSSRVLVDGRDHARKPTRLPKL